MLTVVTGLAAALSYALSDMLAQRVSRIIGAVRLMIWALGVGVVVVVPVALVVEGLPADAAQWRAAGLACVAGVVYVAGYFTLLSALRRGDLSLVTALSSLQGAFVAGAAIAGGEPITPLVAAGLVLAVVGGVLAATQGRAKTAAGAGLAVVAGLLFALFIVLYDRAAALPWLSQAAFARLTSFLMLLPVALVQRGLWMERALRPAATASGLLEVGGLVLLAASVSLGPLAVAGVMTAQYATFALLLGLAILKERPRPHQLAGVACTIASVTILSSLR